jgi:hypothetical protein
MADGHRHSERGGKIAFQRPRVSVLLRLAIRFPLRRTDRPSLGQSFDLPHGQTLGNRLTGERRRVVCRDEGARVSRRKPAVAKHLQYIIRQVQKPHEVGDMAPALAHGGGELFLRVAEAIQQLAISLRLFHGVEVGALNVLDDGDFQHLGIVEVADDDGKLVNLGTLRRAPASFTGHDLEALTAWVRPDDQRLYHTLLADRCGKLLQRAVRERTARLIGIWEKSFHRHALLGRPWGNRSLRGSGFRRLYIGHQGRKPAAQSLAVLLDRHHARSRTRFRSMNSCASSRYASLPLDAGS